jgi:transketolase C-terminal domain/subunit
VSTNVAGPDIKTEASRDEQAANDAAPIRGMGKALGTNMNASLSIPTATSVRTIPAKLMIDNRIVINNPHDTVAQRQGALHPLETGPSVVRFPKTPLVTEVPATRTAGSVDVLFEFDDVGPADVLLISMGAMAEEALTVAHAVMDAGFTVRLVDPRYQRPGHRMGRRRSAVAAVA